MATVSSFPYQTDSLPTLASGAQSLLNQGIAAAREAIHSFVSQGDLLVLRQEVPIERWCFDFRAELKSMTKEECKARAYALLYTLEGAVRAVVEAVQLLIAKCFSKDVIKETRHSTILEIQSKSVMLTAWAIVNPTAVKNHVKEVDGNNRPLLGCLPSQMQWGTPYFGEFTIPISANYNWRP